MPKLSLAGLRDPKRRGRYIIWTGVVGLLMVGFLITTLGITSTRWFCSNGCHKVQDDTIVAYEHSSHSNISCLACHMPVNANAAEFMFHKVEALAELYLTVTDTYELPLNAESEVAHEMSTEQCTQCHNLETRKVTASKGVVIDHAVHIENDINCTTCHNRVAHREDFQLKLKDPRTNKQNHKHEDNMKMEACFRCHGLEKDARAPGTCLTCHPRSFQFKPESHLQKGFYSPKGGPSKGHWRLKKQRPEYCRTCHDEKTFCTGCHGVQMPHPGDWKQAHGKQMKSKTADLDSCRRCHYSTLAGTNFCNDCHHSGADPKLPWVQQHFNKVRAQGAAPCFECHDPTFCARCHVRSVR